MDQKVAPDIVAFIADSIANLPQDPSEIAFTKNDIWLSPYFRVNMPQFFAKPPTDEETARSEYDKVAAQPLKSLAYAGILEETKIQGANHYLVVKPQLLDWIALSAANSYRFLVQYIVAVLRQSGFDNHLQRYISSGHDAGDMALLKEKFQAFVFANTKIQGTLEVNRIFPKVINPIACSLGIPGIVAGKVSPYPFSYSDLMYNRTNWRDFGKSKAVTRGLSRAGIPRASLLDYEMRKVKLAVKKTHGPSSELSDSWAKGDATHVHHIFPVHTHPQLASVAENLILLTATQHNFKAHPGNNTRLVDSNYQVDCLVAKIRSIDMQGASSLIYSFENMIRVIEIGYNVSINNAESWDELVAFVQRFRK